MLTSGHGIFRVVGRSVAIFVANGFPLDGLDHFVARFREARAGPIETKAVSNETIAKSTFASPLCSATIA
jgi:hypothetical protein